MRKKGHKTKQNKLKKKNPNEANKKPDNHLSDRYEGIKTA